MSILLWENYPGNQQQVYTIVKSLFRNGNSLQGLM